MSRDESWRQERSCSDPTVFFPNDRGLYPFKDEAVTICEQCPVQAKCLDHSIAKEEWIGVWGGFTDRPRRYFDRANTEIVIRAQFGAQISAFISHYAVRSHETLVTASFV